jgi:anti-anti-sigma regulatory factor
MFERRLRRRRLRRTAVHSGPDPPEDRSPHDACSQPSGIDQIVRMTRPQRIKATAGRRTPGELSLVWSGAVTAHRVPQLREDLYRQLESPGCMRIRLHVDQVTAIDEHGIALLIGANHRAAAAGLSFVLIDTGGPVTKALARIHVLNGFLVTQVIENHSVSFPTTTEGLSRLG